MTGAGALGLGALVARPSFGSPLARAPLAPLAPVAPVTLAAARPVLAGMCPLVVEQIQGPFYLDLDLQKQVITDGKPGLPMTLIFQVVHAATCAPIPGAVVEVWQNDAVGLYSGIASLGTLGQSYLRGYQVTNNDGIAWFQTIYPGWYPGRTTHLHIKVRPDATHEATSQVYFQDGLSNLVYQVIAPYTDKGPKDTTNPQDGWFDPAMLAAWIPNPDHSLSIWAGMILGV